EEEGQDEDGGKLGQFGRLETDRSEFDPSGRPTPGISDDGNGNEQPDGQGEQREGDLAVEAVRNPAGNDQREDSGTDPDQLTTEEVETVLGPVDGDRRGSRLGGTESDDHQHHDDDKDGGSGSAVGAQNLGPVPGGGSDLRDRGHFGGHPLPPIRSSTSSANLSPRAE